jgi:hypothetical protein
MINSGDLKTFSLIDIFQIIKERKKNCILAIENDNNVYGIYFKNGDPVYIRKVGRSFHLYMDLDFKSVLKRDKISKQDIFKNFTTLLPIILKFKEGGFSITSGFIKYSEDIKPLVNTEKLIILLSRNLSLEEVSRKITDHELIFEKTEKAQELSELADLNDQEREILALVDGKNKVSDIIATIHFDRILKDENILNISDEENIKNLYEDSRLLVKRALYGFLASGMIRKSRKLRNIKKPDIIERILSNLDSKPIKQSLKESLKEI